MADSTHPQASRPLPRPEITKPPGRLARLAGAAGILLVGVLAACGSATGGASSTTPHRGGNLVIDTDTPVSDFDVWSTSDNESIWCLDQITQALYANSSDGKSVYPLLATSYSLSTNDLTWTIQLRHGVRFSNGAEMTSKDVVFSIQQEANQTNDTGWGFLDAQIASVTAEGSYTVAITTKYPWAPMLADLAFFGNAIVPYNYGGETHAQFYQNPIGTGPFMISKWVKGRLHQAGPEPPLLAAGAALPGLAHLPGGRRRQHPGAAASRRPGPDHRRRPVQRDQVGGERRTEGRPVPLHSDRLRDHE